MRGYRTGGGCSTGSEATILSTPPLGSVMSNAFAAAGGVGNVFIELAVMLAQISSLVHESCVLLLTLAERLEFAELLKDSGVGVVANDEGRLWHQLEVLSAGMLACAGCVR